MDFPAPAPVEESSDSDAIIVKADEVDEAGADISTISPSTTDSESEFNARIENRRAADAQTSSPKVLANAVPSPPRPLPRPILRRDGSAPAPPKQPPPPVPPKEDTDKPTDSLSLLQLKKLVGELPKLEPTAYAYEYSETRIFPEELQEWFTYSEEERIMLLRAQDDFEEKWHEKIANASVEEDEYTPWIDATNRGRETFVQELKESLEEDDLRARVKALECLSYITLGTWGDTVGITDEAGQTKEESPILGQAQPDEDDKDNAYHRSQLKWIINGTQLLHRKGIVQSVINVLKELWDSEQGVGERSDAPDVTAAEINKLREWEANHALTVLYLIVEASRNQNDLIEREKLRRSINSIKPHLLVLVTQILAKSRWDEPDKKSCMPRHKVLLLFWKALLLLFGSSRDVVEAKKVLKTESLGVNGRETEGYITASPLDYHLFRQEITSKYPTYSPPPTLIPIESENNTILPPLPNHSSRQSIHDEISSISSTAAVGRSIFNQPVHIATPAPSPPPSPAGPGGKGAKKQNYQTNQNFPFLYPPLDESSNAIGGKGSTELQDRLANKRWQGGDVPASIYEAGQLFASRMRMSRSIRQLWDVRERYIKEERGWGDNIDGVSSGNGRDETTDPRDDNDRQSADDDDDDDDLLESPECVEKRQFPESASMKNKMHTGPRETEDDNVQSRLDAVDTYYRAVLPEFQSLVMVLWQEMLKNISVVLANSAANQNNSTDEALDGIKRKTNANSSASLNALANGHIENAVGPDVTAESLNDIRTKEISSKAVSGLLLILLKWFKISHVLKYEYLTQLLLDANWLPLILKFFAHQDVDKAVEQRNDRDDLDFFTFCQNHSKHPPPSPPQPALSPSDSDSSDEAVPPPIRKHRHSPTSKSPPRTPPLPQSSRLPEVDELGFSTAGSTLPQTPLTTYAPRFFLTNINLLRLLQKITKRKAHRALLLVQYKSSQMLRKALKIPQPDLRLYTLKLFKSQVPYCGRKWRQTNMRVITAIYLHCRPELRDEWLCGGDVDGVVEEAVPVEQAARALVHWWHLKTYRESMEGKAAPGREKEEYDFFARELERMGWGGGDGGSIDGEAEGGGDSGQGQGGGPEFEGGPLRMEGWA